MANELKLAVGPNTIIRDFLSGLPKPNTESEQTLRSELNAKASNIILGYNKDGSDEPEPKPPSYETFVSVLDYISYFIRKELNSDQNLESLPTIIGDIVIRLTKQLDDEHAARKNKTGFFTSLGPLTYRRPEGLSFEDFIADIKKKLDENSKFDPEIYPFDSKSLVEQTMMEMKILDQCVALTEALEKATESLSVKE